VDKSALIDSLIETARKTQAISSSSEKGRVLRDLATQPVYDDRIVTAILEALSSLKSSEENASVLRALLARADLSSNAFAEIARAIKSISSSEVRAGVLKTMVQSCPTAAAVLLAFLDTTFSISSSSEQEEILLALLRRKGLSTRIVSQVKEMASSKIASAANRNSVLNAVSKYEREHEFELDGVGCLSKLGTLAVGKRAGFRLPLPGQEDKAFMWKAPSFHPLQVLENAYQRVVRKAGQAPGADPIKVQSETLSRFFIQDPGQAECFTSRPLDQYDGEQLAAVRMNHLIETFYLFRLLVHYRVESGAEIGEDLRVELSGELTKLLHNGDRAKMSWLSDWLTKKIGELGRRSTR